jgi:hypothetical protein
MHRGGGRGDARASCASPLGTPLAADHLNVKIPAARLELRKNFSSASVCEEWTNIPSDIKYRKNARSFMHAYRRHLGYYPSQAQMRESKFEKYRRRDQRRKVYMPAS